MLFANQKDLTKVLAYADELKKVDAFLASFSMKDFVPGNSIQVADNIKANLIEYQTKTRAEGFWEAHKKMVDVHYILSGAENVDLNFDDSLEKGDYQPEREMYELFGENKETFTLDKTNNFLLLFPDEAHRPGCIVDVPKTVQKIVFKIDVK